MEEYNDQIEGRNAVLEYLESGKDINKILVATGEKHGSINKIIAIAKDRKIIITEIEMFLHMIIAKWKIFYKLQKKEKKNRL